MAKEEQHVINLQNSKHRIKRRLNRDSSIFLLLVLISLLLISCSKQEQSHIMDNKFSEPIEGLCQSGYKLITILHWEGLEGSPEILKYSCINQTTIKDCIFSDIDEERKKCYKDFLETSNDIKRCDSIANIDLSMMEFIKEIGRWRREDLYISECKGAYAVKFDNVESCGEINMTYLKADCYSYFGKKLLNPEYCYKATGEYDNYDRDSCLNYIADKTNTSESCKVHQDKEQRAQCLYNYAIDTSNLSICYGINEDYEPKRKEWRSYCFERFGIEQHNLSLCTEAKNFNSIEFGNHRASCYYSVATHYGNSSICDTMDITSHKNQCYYKIALNTNNINLCKKANHLVPKDSHDYVNSCINKIAIKKRNISICDEIRKTSILREDCRRKIS
ncbi:hypothetical protein CMO89_03570 [Candidatus Woesearchaeota archaeon]|nr:hypothetical protein [Candidatus Woesearchaeota archaeon]|tara:strand:- start:8741 stop:9910 length:1170 start_codon:yes stop_codon:yes gene_type:complete